MKIFPGDIVEINGARGEYIALCPSNNYNDDNYIEDKNAQFYFFRENPPSLYRTESDWISFKKEGESISVTRYRGRDSELTTLIKFNDKLILRRSSQSHDSIQFLTEKDLLSNKFGIELTLQSEYTKEYVDELREKYSHKEG